jgi:hypothetical protein
MVAMEHRRPAQICRQIPIRRAMNPITIRAAQV